MKGKEFRAIRKFNSISQRKIANHLGFKDTHVVSRVENKEVVPPIYIKALSDELGYDLMNTNLSNKMISEIPDEYFKETRGRKKRKPTIHDISIFGDLGYIDVLH